MNGMRLTLRGSHAYCDGLPFSHCGAGDGHRLQPGSYPLRAEFSTTHGRELPFADGLGLVGAVPESAVILGRVLGRTGPIPCKLTEARLVSLLLQNAELGYGAVLEILPHG